MDIPVHITTCYLEPENVTKNDISLSHLSNIICSLRLPSSRIVVSGDFNKRMQDVTKILIAIAKDLIPIIPEWTPIHAKGYHLDQVLTNIPI